MKNLLRALVLLMVAASMTASLAQAQAAKRVVKIDEATGELVDVTEVQEVARAASVQKSTLGQGATSAVQDQAASVIEDSPLNMSAAERRRRDRQNLELQTEQKIVEKLEDARMEDERSRSERLFNKGFSSRDQQPEQQVQVVTPPTPVVVVEPKVEPKAVESKQETKQEAKVDVKSEVRAALTELNAKTEESSTQYYMSGLVGFGDYPDAKNIRGNMAVGFSFGLVTSDRFVAEGTFQYSQFDIDTMYSGVAYSTPAYKEMTQYNFQAAMKYQLLGGRVRPVVGAVASYTHRSYEGQQYSYYSGSGSDVSTNAFDVGALAGVDVQITANFSIGADARYMTNVAFRENSDYGRSFVYGRTGKSVEEFNYYLGSLVGKFSF